MATASGTIQATTLTDMVDAVKNYSSLTLQAWTIADPTSTLIESKTPVFVNGTAGVIDLTAELQFTIPSSTTVGFLKLYNGAILKASATLTTDNYFADGGILKVPKFEIKAV